MSTSNEATVIGETILITGSLTGDEDLNILGRVEGSVSLSRTLMVAESGVVRAEVKVRNAIVSGIVVGNISASDSIEITETGRLLGNLQAPRIIIVSGARVSGEIDMGDLETPRAALPAREAPPHKPGLMLSKGLPARAALPARRTPQPVAAAKTVAPPALGTRPATSGPKAASSGPARATPQASAPIRASGKVHSPPVLAKKLKRKVVVKRK